MRRLARHVMTPISALSLLLFMAVCVLWARSYGLADRVGWSGDDGWRYVRSAKGHVVIGLLLGDRSSDRDRAPPHWPKYERDEARHPSDFPIYRTGLPHERYLSWERGGFAWHESRNLRRGTLHIQGIAPFRSLAAATVALPLWWTTTRVRSQVRARRRKRMGLCPACGYDLRESPGRCPECGVLASSGGDT